MLSIATRWFDSFTGTFFRAYNKLPRFLRDQIKLRGNFIIGIYGICYIFYERYPVSYLYQNYLMV